MGVAVGETVSYFSKLETSGLTKANGRIPGMYAIISFNLLHFFSLGLDLFVVFSLCCSSFREW